jgi:putative ribosome biogenesis GTPase RsgA
VRAAVEAGEVSLARYESYRKLRQEIEDGTPPEWA